MLAVCRAAAIAVLLLSDAAPADVAAPVGVPGTHRLPVEAFAAAGEFLLAALSPDGSRVAALTMGDSGPVVSIYRLDGAGLSARQVFELPPSLFGWFEWTDNGTVLMSYTEIPRRVGRKDRLRRVLERLSVSQATRQVIRSYEVDPLAANDVDSVLHVLPDDANHVLYAFAPDGGFYPGVYRLDIRDGGLTEVEAPQRSVLEWYADWQGHVRVASGLDRRNRPVVRLRDTPQGEWTSVRDNGVFANGWFEIAGFNAAGTSIYVRSAIGKGRVVLYEFDIAKRRIVKKIFGHPRVDVMNVIISDVVKGPVAATYIDDLMETVPLDQGFGEFMGRIEARLAGRSNFVAGMSDDGRVKLIYSELPPVPASLYAYFDDSDSLVPVRDGPEQLRADVLVRPQRVTYFARDGLEIPAYITVPAGVAAEKLPLVVLPHGGPWARDYITYYDWAQFLANRGYLVLQPNFRGSTGYGRYFEARGYGEWGEAMQDDITDGVRWLVRQGMADEHRVCIAGSSYGGYAALMGVIRTPALYRCAVAFAPVTDLRRWLARFKRTPHYQGMVARVQGERDMAYLNENSPALHAQEVGAPILLVHASGDIRVPIEHSRRMRRALGKAHKPVEYLELDGGSHFLLQPEHRRAVLSRMEQFIGRQLGPAAGP